MLSIRNTARLCLFAVKRCVVLQVVLNRRCLLKKRRIQANFSFTAHMEQNNKNATRWNYKPLVSSQMSGSIRRHFNTEQLSLVHDNYIHNGNRRRCFIIQPLSSSYSKSANMQFAFCSAASVFHSLTCQSIQQWKFFWLAAHGLNARQLLVAVDG